MTTFTVRWLLVAAGLVAAGVQAQEIQTACANLPQQGIVGSQQGPEFDVPPRRQNGQWVCQAGFRLLTVPVLRCRGPSTIPVNGNPQALCYANLAFRLDHGGFPVALRRPIPDRCPAPAFMDIVVRGTNIGFTDVKITPLTADGRQPAPGIKLAARRASGPQVPTHEDPVLSHCRAYDCVRLGLEIAANAPDLAVIRFALPGGRQLDYQTATAPKCPPPRVECRRRPGYTGPTSVICMPA
jgi:hypothetical protein